MKIAIDLDWTICELRKEWQKYDEVIPNLFAVEKIKKLKETWHYIILQTARHMETCNSNIWLVNAKVTKTTIDRLEKYNIPYDEIYFWKPNADIYIDDNAKTFISWDAIEDIENFDEQKINIVIPMAWAWSRFAKAGYTIPKPLIDALWKPMYEWAVSSFDFLEKLYNIQYIFIVQQEHIDNFDIEKKIKSIYRNSIIIPINQITRWQAESVLKAKKHINNLNKLIIFNADTYAIFDEDDFPIHNKKIDGLISCFTSQDIRYSYAKLDKFWYVEEVREKEVISSNATNWMYYFRRWIDFVNFAERMIDTNKTVNEEFYVWPMYTNLIRSGKRIKINSIKENRILWTPEELEMFIQNYKI